MLPPVRPLGRAQGRSLSAAERTSVDIGATLSTTRAARIPYFDNFNVADLFILKKLIQYRAMESGNGPFTFYCTLY